MNDFLKDLLSLGKKIVEVSEAVQAEIDKRSPVTSKSRKSDSAIAAESAAHSEPADYSTLFAKHLLNGCPNPLDLLTESEAASFLNCPIQATTTGEEEYIGVHYGCTDDRSMYISLSVSALMPWDYVRDEVSTQPAARIVGDEALNAGDILYVRKGANFFWIYGRSVDESKIFDIAEHIAARIGN